MRCTINSCPDCGERLIHQVNRQGNESASGFGQWVQKVLRRSFGFADVDGVVERTRNGQKLIREYEHKQPWHKFEWSQESLLRAKAEMYQFCISQGFKFADGTRLSPESGVFVVRCEVNPDITLNGTVTVTHMATGESVEMSQRYFALWFASRKDERAWDLETLMHQFVYQNQFETLALDGV